jgi:acetyl esterase/lipase
MEKQSFKMKFMCFILGFLLISLTLSLYALETEPRIKVEPVTQLFGIPASIKVVNLKAGESVTIRAHSKDGLGVDWKSMATYTANKVGVVDLEKHSPVSGDYTGVDPLGLLWSMKPVALKNNRVRPYHFENLDAIVIQLHVETSSGKSATVEIKRFFQLPSTELLCTPIEHEELEGILYHPSDKGPHPCIILLGGSGGGQEEWWAKVMASNGFAALTLAYFNYENLPSELMEIPLEYFQKAITWLQSQKAIDSERIAIMGGSKGGELALLLGATYSEIKAVVACVPSGVVWQGISQQKFGSSWSLNGKGLDYVQWHFSMEDLQKFQSGQPVSLLKTYSLEEIDVDVLEKATIPVEKINGPILLVSGTDDQMWPSSLFSDLVMKRLEKYNHSYERIHLRYEGAGHLVFLPMFMTSGNRMTLPFMFGGTAKADAHSSVDFWSKMLSFLHKHLD